MSEALLLLAVAVAGAAMGFVNNLAGGGGLIGLLAFQLLCGLDPQEANTALRPAALMIGLLGMVGFRAEGSRIPRRAWGWALLALPGAVAGAILARTLPGWVYQGALFTVIVITAYRQLRRPPRPASAEAAPAGGATLTSLLFVYAGIHMGFLQVAVGLVIMLALSRAHSRDLVAVNTAKMAIVIVTSAASVLILAFSGQGIAWPPAIALALGCGLGSYLAGRWSVRKGHEAIRMAVLAVCAIAVVRMGVQLLAG